MKIVITTCDKNNWLIPIFLYFLKKNWPDNPYPVEIVTESEPLEGTVFYTGGVSWSSGVIDYLKQSDEQKFLLVLEDHLFKKPVDTAHVILAEQLCAGNVGCVRLTNAPHKYFSQHSVSSKIEGFREYPLSRRFAMTLQIAIFQKQFLLDVLRPNEDVWQVESKGSKRLRKPKVKWGAIWPEKKIIDTPPTGLLIKGRLKPPVLRWVKKELNNDTSDTGKEMKKIIEDKIIKARSKNLVFIDVGELGWSLFLSAHFRWMKENSNAKVGIITLRDRGCLYNGVADVVMRVPRQFFKKYDRTMQDSFKLRKLSWAELRHFFRSYVPEGYRLAESNEYPTHLYNHRRIFKPYGYSRPPEKSREILVFPRCRAGLWGERRNLPGKFYKNLCKRLCDEFPKLTVRTIGTRAGAYDMRIKRSNYINWIGRGRTLQDLIDHCQSAVVAIGGQSAPPKIALLQSLPTFMIGHQKEMHTIEMNWMKTKVGFYEIDKRGYSKLVINDCIDDILAFVRGCL